METLFNKVATACTPPVFRGAKQNHYMFKRERASGIFSIPEFTGKWSSTVEGAEAQLDGEGWRLFQIAKYDQV